MNFKNLFRMLCVAIMLLGCNQSKKFSSSEWKKWQESENIPGERWLMSKDLLKKHRLKGLSRDSIIILLGKPDVDRNDKYYYNIGYPQNPAQLDPASLVIYFRSDRVKKVKISEQ